MHKQVLVFLCSRVSQWTAALNGKLASLHKPDGLWSNTQEPSHTHIQSAIKSKKKSITEAYLHADTRRQKRTNAPSFTHYGVWVRELCLCTLIEPLQKVLNTDSNGFLLFAVANTDLVTVCLGVWRLCVCASQTCLCVSLCSSGTLRKQISDNEAVFSQFFTK